VASSVKGTYVITFEGALQGQNLAPVTVTLADAQSGPAGSFTLTLGGQTTRNISYTADGAALAKKVQTELARLSNVGAGNVQVSFNAEQSNAGTLGLDIEFTGALAQSNAAEITANLGSLSNATLSVRTVAQGVQGVQQQQWVVLGTQAQANGYRLSLTHEGQTYTTAVIAGNATQAQIQAAVDAGFGAIAGARFTVTLGQAGTDQEDTLKLAVGGSLAGSNLNLVTVQVPGAQASGTPVTRSFVVGNSAANIANLKSAYAQLLDGHDGVAVTDADIDVHYSRTSAGERYVVSFVGKLAGTDIDPKGIDIPVRSGNLAHEAASHPLKISRPLVHHFSAWRNHNHTIDLVAGDQLVSNHTGSNGFACTRRCIDHEMAVTLARAQPVESLVEGFDLPIAEFDGHRLIAFLKVAVRAQSVPVRSDGLASPRERQNVIGMEVMREPAATRLASTAGDKC
jgi:hypothetical protein